jgi:uncharacterized protein (DUF2345 family)
VDISDASGGPDLLDQQRCPFRIRFSESASPLDAVLRVQSVDIEEQLNGSVHGRVTCVSRQANLPLQAFQGVPATHAGGVKAVAHQGPVNIQSQHDDTLLDSAKNIQLRAVDNVTLMGKVLTFIAEDGSFIKVGGGGITLGSNGPVAQKAASFPHSGPATMATEVPTFSKGEPDGRFVLRFDPSDPNSIAAQQRHRITLSDGSQIEGVSDAAGLTSLTPRQAMHIASVQILSGA